VRLVFRDQVALLVPPAGEIDLGPAHQALLDHLDQRGACFWPELVQATAAAGLHYDEREVLTTLWDLVWAGLVTNDSLAPVRAFVNARPARRTASRPRPGRLARLGPPAGSGRWSLVAPLLDPRPSATEAAHGKALQLLERYGVLTREAALGEGLEGGFAGVYPVLKALEERGRVRRGYFVAGLGAAQFALPGAVDRLRSFRDDGDSVYVLAATDPAQPYGAALPWPERPDDDTRTGRPARAARAYVVLLDGALVAYLERGARTLHTFAPDPDWCGALLRLVKDGRLRQIELATIDGRPVREHPHADAWRAVGARDTPRGLVVRG